MNYENNFYKPTRAVLSLRATSLAFPRVGWAEIELQAGKGAPLTGEYGPFFGIFHSGKVFSFVFLTKHFRGKNLKRPNLASVRPPRFTYGETVLAGPRFPPAETGDVSSPRAGGFLPEGLVLNPEHSPPETCT